jgi:Protein of unknown function (DUF1574)
MATSNRIRIDRSVVLWTGLFLLVAHVGMKIALETNLHVLDQPRFEQGLRFLRKARAANPPRPFLAVFGSSRTQEGVDPAAMMERFAGHGIDAEVFNFSRAGAGPAYEFLTLRRLADRGMLPDVAVFELLPILLVCDPKHVGPIEKIEESLLYPSEKRDLVRRGWIEPGNPWREMFLETPWFENRPALLQRVAPRWVDTTVDLVTGPDDRGYVCMNNDSYPSAEWERTVTKIGSRMVPQMREFGANKITDESAHATLAECQRLGVRAILLLTPEGPRVRSFYARETHEALVDYARKLAESHGATFVNANSWFDDESLFLDSHHLQIRGADAFSRRLADEIADQMKSPQSVGSGGSGSR